MFYPGWNIMTGKLLERVRTFFLIENVILLRMDMRGM